ncbi:MAG: hypothetical protein HY665_06680 [Chloroflexi bacterium]|nr:hypothetical protein [Chloroflexota bacterium]
MPPSIRDLLLLSLVSANGRIASRTTFQKLTYFYGMKTGIQTYHRAHYYGPYSAAISDEIASLSASGIISECVDTYPSFSFGVSFEPRKYSYCLTEAGTTIAKFIANNKEVEAIGIKRILEDMQEVGAKNDYKSLSVAAKMHHILKAKQRMLPSQILGEAKQLGWTITEDEAKKSIEFLQKMGLVKIEASNQ